LWGITRPRPRGVRIRHRPFLRCLEETLPDTSRKTASDRLRKFSNRGGLKRGLCGITPTCYKVQRYSKCAIFSGFPQETKPVGEVTQARGHPSLCYTNISHQFRHNSHPFYQQIVAD